MKSLFQPFLIAARSQTHRSDICDHFLICGVDINVQGKTSGNSALMVAVENKNIFMVKYLLEKNINKDLKNVKGKTALDIAKDMLKEGKHSEELEKIIELLSA